MKAKIMIARFPGNFSEHPDSSDYAWDVAIGCGAMKYSGGGPRWRTYECEHERFDKLFMWNKSDTPITMVRNLCVEDAKNLGVDYLLMIDSDMSPDEQNPGSVPFFRVAMDFLWRKEHPACIAAPYVGPGPHQNIFVFRWRNYNNQGITPMNLKLAQFNREEASERGGIEKVAALPTGLILFDMRLFNLLDGKDDGKEDGKDDRGYFYYEHDPRETEKHSTEDVTMTRDWSLVCAGLGLDSGGCYCAWDSWSEHVKLTHFGKPKQLSIDSVGQGMRKALERNRTYDEQLVMVGDSGRLNYPKENGQQLPEVDDRVTQVDGDEHKDKVQSAYPELMGREHERI